MEINHLARLFGDFYPELQFITLYDALLRGFKCVGEAYFIVILARDKVSLFEPIFYQTFSSQVVINYRIV